jgi:hypothetical protein
MYEESDDRESAIEPSREDAAVAETPPLPLVRGNPQVMAGFP